MLIGMNLLLWTGHVTDEHVPILEDLKRTGFDGVEVPIFDASDPAHYTALGKRLDDLGLRRTAVTIVPDEEHSPISPDPAIRQAAAEHLKRVMDCAKKLGAEVLVGPYFQPLGIFSGEKPQADEMARCVEVHREVAPLAREAGMTCALEPLNRFEAYLLNTCEQAIDHVRNVDEQGFGILYDTFHANIEEKDPLAALQAVNDAGALVHVHISENDRGTPGRGHAPIAETIAALRAMDYDGWLTIEAFGRAVPELAAATRVWRDFFADPREVYTEGFEFISKCWADAAISPQSSAT